MSVGVFSVTGEPNGNYQIAVMNYAVPGTRCRYIIEKTALFEDLAYFLSVAETFAVICAYRVKKLFIVFCSIKGVRCRPLLS